MHLNERKTNYKILFGKDFLREVKKLDKSGNDTFLINIQRIIDELKINPHKKRPKIDIKLISPKKESIYRVRLGNYRLIYEIDESNKTVLLTIFFVRGKGYK